MIEALTANAQTTIAVFAVLYILTRDIILPLVRGRDKQLAELSSRISKLENSINNLGGRFSLLANIIHSNGVVEVPESLRNSQPSQQ